MAGLPPPPYESPPPLPDGDADRPPTGPPIRRPGATLPQPEPPAPPPPAPPRRIPTAGQLVAVAAGVVAALALAVGAVALFDGADDTLDTAVAADTVTDIVEDSGGTGTVDGCPVDLEDGLEQVSEDLASDAVFDALDLGDPQMTVGVAPSGRDAMFECALVLPDGTSPTVIAVVAIDDADDFDDFVEDIDRRGRVRDQGRHRGGRTFTFESSSGPDAVEGALWGDDHLIVTFGIGATAGAEVDIDSADLAHALETLLPHIVDELGAP